jgi:hypothetical protein
MAVTSLMIASPSMVSTSLCQTFLWNGGRPRIDWSRVCTPRSAGGLGLLPIDMQSRCLHAKWFARVYGSDVPPWRGLARHLLESHLAGTKLPPHALLTSRFTRSNCRRLPQVWRERLLTWTTVQGNLITNLDNISAEAALALPLKVAIRTRAGLLLTSRSPSYMSDLLTWSPELCRLVRRDDTPFRFTRIINRLQRQDLVVIGPVFRKLLCNRQSALPGKTVIARKGRTTERRRKSVTQ